MIRTLRLPRDERGAVSFEVLIVIIFMILFLLLPIVDLVNAGVQYISAYQAMRDLGQYTQYHPPSDPTNWSSWANGLPTVGNYVITTSVVCGDAGAICGSGSGPITPKFYSFSTVITLSPLVIPSLKGSFTLTYSERFQ